MSSPTARRREAMRDTRRQLAESNKTIIDDLIGLLDGVEEYGPVQPCTPPNGNGGHHADEPNDKSK